MANAIVATIARATVMLTEIAFILRITDTAWDMIDDLTNSHVTLQRAIVGDIGLGFAFAAGHDKAIGAFAAARGLRLRGQNT